MGSQDSNQKTLRYSIKDGVFASLMSGFTADYFTPFLLLLGGTNRHVGILSALPNLFASLIQLKSPDFTDRLKSRKKVISIFALLQGAALIPMVFAYLFGQARVAAFIAIVTLFTSLGAVIGPALGSLMADLVQEGRRGEYFGWRNRTLGLVTIVSTFTAGFILHGAEKYNVFWGFAAIFTLAFVFRLVSWRYLNKMHEPEFTPKKDDYFSIIDFISRANTSNFARFVIFVSVMKFAVNIASPFFAVLMLRDLKFSYLTYTGITLAATLATNLTITRWGVHSDRVGNLKVLRLASKMVAFVPLLWLINQNPVYLFFVQVFSGFSWAGFNLSASNFIYDASSPGKRARCIAYYNAFTGLALCLGALAGVALAHYLPEGYLGSILNLVLISAALRLAVAFFMPFKMKEVREVAKIKTSELFFSMLRLSPALQFIGRERKGKRFFFF